MLCILLALIFIILYPILGIFSKSFRVNAKKAISCAFKRATLRKCDDDFGKEFKDKFLSKLIFKYPKVAKFFDKTLSFWLLLIVVINIVGLIYFLVGALNLFVYDTCYPTNGESCSLSGEACSVDSVTSPSILDTIKRIPSRLKTWEAKEYISETATYYKTFDNSKPVALEIIDPLCTFCKKLWGNINEAKFTDRYNLTYIAYPIPEGNGYKFKNSYVIASYMEALKKFPLANSDVQADWRLLDKIFTDKKDGIDMQEVINISYSNDQTVEYINKSLKEFGYTDEQIALIKSLAESSTVKETIKSNRDLVENKIQTIKIPTIIFNGVRHDRVVDVEGLK